VTRFIHHRINTLKAGNMITPEFGAEVDLRLHQSRLVLSHEPLEDWCDFNIWLSAYKGSLLVINVKEMGLEDMIVNEIKRVNSSLDYFFLDQSIPYLIKSIAKGYKCAARISEFETTESAFLQNTSWLWVDSFTGDWSHLSEISSKQAKESMKRKICLVSPELQGRSFENSKEVSVLVNQIEKLKLELDGVCTKFASAWKKLLA
jgi:hypothetical protein